MFDSATDPLGIALKSRAASNRFSFAQQHPGSSFGPLPDSRWDGFFQAMDEAGVKNLGDSSTKPGYGPQFGSLPSTYNPAYQTSAVETMPSNQVGVAGGQAPNGVAGDTIGSMDSLLRATGGQNVRKALGRR